MPEKPDAAKTGTQSILTERGAAKLIVGECRDKVPALKDVKVDYNLGGKSQREIASMWEKGGFPAKVQPDLLFVFKEFQQTEPFLIAVELKLFENIRKVDLYAGWGQVLTYGLFGFDGLALWHLLKEEPSSDDLERLQATGEKLSKDWGLTIWYLAGQIDGQSKSIRTRISSMAIPGVVSWMYNTLVKEQSRLRFNSDAMKLRSVLKADLRIPY